MKTAIVIVNWNGAEDTRECLRSIERTSSSEDVIIILVDNGSRSPLSDQDISALALDVEYIRLPANVGFTGGNNAGIKRALELGVQYILLLNNDTVLIANIVDDLVQVLERNAEIGVAGAVNYFYHNHQEVWQAGGVIDFKKIQIKQVVPPVELESNNLIDVDYVPGSCLMIRASLLREAGLFDERYFAYAEEADLCYRVKGLGHRVVVVAHAKILHKVGKSSGNLIRAYLETRNRLYFFKSKAVGTARLRVFLNLILKPIVKGMLELALGNWESLLCYLWGIRDYVRQDMGEGSLERVMKLKHIGKRISQSN